MKTHCNCNQIDDPRKKTKSKLSYEDGPCPSASGESITRFILKPAVTGVPVSAHAPWLRALIQMLMSCVSEEGRDEGRGQVGSNNIQRQGNGRWGQTWLRNCGSQTVVLAGSSGNIS